MWTNRNISIRRFLVALAVVTATGSAATRTVGPPFTQCPNAQYSNITDAVNAANPGDVIEVCPALYAEQLLITKPLTIRGLSASGFGRVLIQPSTLTNAGGLAFQAVITAMNTTGVTIENLVVDASQNTLSGCGLGLAGIHFYNSSGSINDNAITGAQVANPQSCTATYPASGFGIRVEATQAGPYRVSIQRNSIHDFTRDGILVSDAANTVDVGGNAISGTGPASGGFQFGIFIAVGAVATVHDNQISMGPCGALSYDNCAKLRSEGVTLRVPGEGTIVEHNFISTVQSGIFANSGDKLRIANNVIQNIDALDGITIQGTTGGSFTNSIIEGNVISHVSPVSQYCSEAFECCGINEYSESGVSGNTIRGNTVIDAYCGVAAVAADKVVPGQNFSTLYPLINSDDYEDAFPSPAEPGASPHALPAKQVQARRPPVRKLHGPDVDQ
jgi:nitrous oxidase accessory protein NosD